eukprot:jgi/Astpho2/1220/Aster-07071
MASASTTIQELNKEYEVRHRAFEDNFWATKMGLKGNSSTQLAQTKTALDDWLGDPANLNRVRELLKTPDLTPAQRHVLSVFDKTFACYITEDPEAREIKERLNQLEADLAQWRNKMQLGYKDPKSGEFRKASSVQLRNTMRTNPDEATRKACWEAMRSIGPHIVGKFCEIVKLRNRLAKVAGFEDYYDMKVQQAEGFSKRRLFEMLSPLEEQSRIIMQGARKRLAADKGEAAGQPWNENFMLSGDLDREQDPYFQFISAVDVWARTFAALGIRYRGATMQLDLCDREGKYSNGFCHWPRCAWKQEDGTWTPSQANFTSLADPSAIGSGKTALVTLLHEGGHAAHFANVTQGSPLFSQERAPTSVAYAETQSMFLDSLASDADWMARYALDSEGNPMPWDLIKRSIEQTHPFSVFGLRAMLAVPFFEKALYELPEEKVTPEEVQALAAQVEIDIEGRPSPRPLLAVPHILADESSAYYHAYVLAEMAVHQARLAGGFRCQGLCLLPTRHYLKRKYHQIVDNDKVGKELEEGYWSPGNGTAYLELVQSLTGAPLSADAWLAELRTSVPDKLREEEKEYHKAVKAGPKLKAGQEPELDMYVRLVHGDQVIVDSKDAGGIGSAVGRFSEWIKNEYAT